MISLLFYNTLLIGGIISALVLVVLLLSPVLNKRYQASWRLNIWKVFMTFLIIPVGPILRFLLNKQEVKENIATIKDSVAKEAIPISTEPVTFQMLIESRPLSIWAKLIDMGPQWLPIIWITGSCIVTIYLISVYIHFTRNIKRNSEPVINDSIDDVQNKVLSAHRRTRPIPVYQCSKIPSPMIVGILKPAIFIPQRDYGTTNLQIILTHELTHYLRNDLLYKALFIMALILHWYNPFVHKMIKLAGNDMEICCDLDAIKGKNKEFRSNYSDMLMGEIIRRRQSKAALFACMGGDKKIMEERFRSIFSNNTRRGRICFLSALTLVIIISGFAYASDYDAANFDGSLEHQKLIDEAILSRQAKLQAGFAKNRQEPDREHRDIPNFDELARMVEDEDGNLDLLEVYKLAGVEPPDFAAELDPKKYESYYNLTNGYIEPHVLGNGLRAVYSETGGEPWKLKKGDIVEVCISADIDRLEPEDYVYLNGKRYTKVKGYLTWGYIDKNDEYIDVRQKFKIDEQEQIEFKIPENGEYNFYLFCPSSSDIVIKWVSIKIK